MAKPNETGPGASENVASVPRVFDTSEPIDLRTPLEVMLALPPEPIPPKPLYGARSSQWPAARAAHLRLHPACAVTGQTRHVEVHHVIPFHERPDLELDPENLITLAEASVNTHFMIGHLLSWHSHNPDVRKDAAWWAAKIRRRPGSGLAQLVRDMVPDVEEFPLP